MKFFTLIFIYSLGLTYFSVYAQSLVEDADLSGPVAGPATSENMFSETIKIISSSKKIFIVTNQNQQLGPGDFISLAVDKNLAARALVAKTHQGQAGLKIVKIYSLNQWSKLRTGLEVQIVKGDDSDFEKKTPPTEGTKNTDSASKIKTEDDLFTADVMVEDNAGIFDEGKNRYIKPDNVIAVSGAFFDANEVSPRSGRVRTNEFGISWAYQFADNYFLEGLYGRAMLDNYPQDGSQTLVNRMSVRLKYNFKGPLYTFFMPYMGFQTFSISSPDAGKSTNQITNQLQNEAIDELKKSGPVFGVTVLRRLVPGWFIKADLGSDLINVGFAIEF
jgi:hypothetical protein